MVYIAKPPRRRRTASAARSETIPNHLALALIGQTVSVLNKQKTVAHGIVAGVVTDTGRPKLIVDRIAYDLNQVLSVTPPVFN